MDTADRNAAERNAADGGDQPTVGSDPGYYTIHGTVEEPPEDDSWALRVSNFEPVEVGTTYARPGDETLVADEPFDPVLLFATDRPVTRRP